MICVELLNVIVTFEISHLKNSLTDCTMLTSLNIHGSMDIRMVIQKAHMGIHGLYVWISIGRSYASQNFWWVEMGVRHVMFPTLLLSHSPHTTNGMPLNKKQLSRPS